MKILDKLWSAIVWSAAITIVPLAIWLLVTSNIWGKFFFFDLVIIGFYFKAKEVAEKENRLLNK